MKISVYLKGLFKLRYMAIKQKRPGNIPGRLSMQILFCTRLVVSRWRFVPLAVDET